MVSRSVDVTAPTNMSEGKPESRGATAQEFIHTLGQFIKLSATSEKLWKVLPSGDERECVEDEKIKSRNQAPRKEKSCGFRAKLLKSTMEISN